MANEPTSRVFQSQDGDLQELPKDSELQGLRERGFALHESGDLSGAERAYREVMRRGTRDLEVLHACGVLCLQTGRYGEALEFITAVMADRELPGLHGELGTALLGLSRFEEAIGSYERALELQPNLSSAHLNRGHALRALGRNEEALTAYERAIGSSPQFFEAQVGRAEVLLDLGRGQEALESYDRAIVMRPDSAQLHFSRGYVLETLKRWDDALLSYGRVIAIAPNAGEAYSNLGNVLNELKRWEAALTHYDKAIEIKPDFAAAYSNRGNVLKELKRWDAALASHNRAIAIDPSYGEAYANRGDVLCELKQYEAAIASYDRAIALRPDIKSLYGMRQHPKMQICDWDGMDADVAQIVESIGRGEAPSNPFVLLALPTSAPLQRKAAEFWVKKEYSPNIRLPPIEKRGRRERIRVGYFSPDFRNHAVSILMAEVFETHDRSKFEVVAFSLGPDTRDEMRGRLEKGFERFVDVHGKSDEQIALLARSMELDIAVDLGGFTEGCRPRVLAMRAAPLQVSYIGYLGTLGAPYMDYLIADPVIVPEAHQEHYAEKIIYLPVIRPTIRSGALRRGSSARRAGAAGAGLCVLLF